MTDQKKSSAERRRERYAAMSDEEREALLEKNREWRARWRAEHPEEYEAQKKKRSDRFLEKYRQDEEFRAKRQAYLRQRYAAAHPQRPAEPAEADAGTPERKPGNPPAAGQLLFREPLH